MIGLVAMARQSPIIRAGLSILAGLLAGVLFYAWNKKMDARHRRELALVGGVATAIIVWLLLGSGGSSVTYGSPGNVDVGGVTVPAGGPDILSPFSITMDGVPNYNYDPSLLFQNPPEYQAASMCGCAERASQWGAYIQQLWSTLDSVFPQGPDGGTTATNYSGVPFGNAPQPVLR